MSVVLTLLNILTYVIIADAILSWLIPSPDRFPRNITSRITAPLYKPVHLILDPRKTGGIDLAPLIIIFAIRAIETLLIRASM